MRIFTKFGVLSAIALLLAGCSSWRVLNPGGQIAQQEANLFWVVLAMSAVVFILVDGGLVYILIRHRERKGDDQTPPRQIYENRLLEVVWTAIPVIIVVVLFVMTVVTMRAVAAPPASSTDIKVTVVGHRWFWEFDYPDLGIKTANELHIPEGTKVQLTLQSVDVIHSFWVPELSGKTDVIPGQTNTMWLTADKTGEYDGQCAEFCGTEHALMRFKIFVDSKADYTTWVAGMTKTTATPNLALVQQGKQYVTQGVCQGCHTIDGTNMAANVGPNLTHLWSRTTFAGGAYPLNDGNMYLWLTDNEAMKPGNLMSNVHIPPEQIPAIIAYLDTLK